MKKLIVIIAFFLSASASAQRFDKKPQRTLDSATNKSAQLNNSISFDAKAKKVWINGLESDVDSVVYHIGDSPSPHVTYIGKSIRVELYADSIVVRQKGKKTRFY